MQAAWSGVQSEVKVSREEFQAWRGDYANARDRLQKETTILKHDVHKAKALWTDHDNTLSTLRSTVHRQGVTLNWLHDKWNVEKPQETRDWTERFTALEQLIESQADAISDLKEEVAILRGKVCRCGESRSSEADAEGDVDLEYEEAEVRPRRKLSS